MFVLKADIKHYFDTVDHGILIRIIEDRIKDREVLWLVRSIVGNYDSGTCGKGMPLGNWTSQFFANVYLNELDQFVKHELKAECYIRYVDDFVILHRSWKTLEGYLDRIQTFLEGLQLELHPDKCGIISLRRGVGFLGFRVFPHFRIPKVRNLRKLNTRLNELLSGYETGHVEAWEVFDSLRGWFGYAMQGDTYHLRYALESKIAEELKERTAIRPSQGILHTKNFQA
ncbi:MAG: RNA-directed DNA polymerase [Nanoarchaeota archaeon]